MADPLPFDESTLQYLNQGTLTEAEGSLQIFPLW